MEIIRKMSSKNNNLRTCKYNKTMQCYYLTRDNAEEFINIILNNFKLKSYECVIECNKDYLYIEYHTGWTEESKTYYYDLWYVNEGDTYSAWKRYTELEFKSKFILQ